MYACYCHRRRLVWSREQQSSRHLGWGEHLAIAPPEVVAVRLYTHGNVVPTKKLRARTNKKKANNELRYRPTAAIYGYVVMVIADIETVGNLCASFLFCASPWLEPRIGGAGQQHQRPHVKYSHDGIPHVLATILGFRMCPICKLLEDALVTADDTESNFLSSTSSHCRIGTLIADGILGRFRGCRTQVPSSPEHTVTNTQFPW